MRKIALAAGLSVLLLILLAAPCLASDEGLRFVDAEGDTGYYVDIYSISIDSSHEYTANVAIIKAKDNTMYSYRMHFDYGARTYQVLYSATMTYDEREISESSSVPQSPRVYAQGSPLAAIVDYLYAWQQGYEK